MKFFKLSHPRYRSDNDEEARNPVSSTSRFWLPGINCENCGAWSSSRRLRVRLPPDAGHFEGVRFMSVADWMRARSEWARLLGVDVEALAPGAKLGAPIGTCRAAITEDVVHSMPGEIWVKRSVREAIEHFTGVSFADVQLSEECGGVQLSELVVHGRAWRQGSTPDSLRLCQVCGRSGFPSPKTLTVDEGRWDGSDFIFLDDNPNIIVVSAPVADLISARGFSNLAMEPIP